MLAAKKTGCSRLLLLTDHEHADTQADGHPIAIRPAYEWTLQRERGQLDDYLA